MSVGPVLTLGLGAFTGGGVQYLPTLGFGTSGIAPPVVVTTTKTGTGGIDPGEGIRRRTPVKPTGLLDRPAKRGKQAPVVEDRLVDAAQTAAEVSAKLAREFSEENTATAAERVARATQARIADEITALVNKRRRTEEEELLLLILMASV